MADIWLKSPLRRKYKGIVFNPRGDVDGYYNLWQGFAKEPIKGQAWRYWQHVHDNICAGNITSYTFVRKWLASVFQHPERLHTALVLCGSQGVGKNSFVEPLGVLLGRHYTPLSSIAELLSNFNDHLKHAVLVHANEALWGGNKKDLGALKSMITESKSSIESKGKNRIILPNFKHLILSSNEEWPVHLDCDDRRFYVLRVSEKRKEDHTYFAAIKHQLEHEGGYEKILFDLLAQDITAFNPRHLPEGNQSFEIKLRSADSTDRYVFQVLQDGYFYAGTQFPTKPWEDIAKELLYDYYKEWCKRSNEEPQTYDVFCKRFLRLVPSVKSCRPRGCGRRTNIYKVPSFEAARQEFCKAYKAKENIWDEDDDSGQGGPESGQS